MMSIFQRLLIFMHIVNHYRTCIKLVVVNKSDPIISFSSILKQL